jgi:hypothetical protein
MKRERARTARAMATGMRVTGDQEGKGDKAMAMATRIAGEWTTTATKRAMVMATRVADKRRRWRAAKRAMATVARAMMMATRMAGKQIDIALINYRIFLHHDVFLRT